MVQWYSCSGYNKRTGMKATDDNDAGLGIPHRKSSFIPYSSLNLGHQPIVLPTPDTVYRRIL